MTTPIVNVVNQTIDAVVVPAVPPGQVGISAAQANAAVANGKIASVITSSALPTNVVTMLESKGVNSSNINIATQAQIAATGAQTVQQAYDITQQSHNALGYNSGVLTTSQTVQTGTTTQQVTTYQPVTHNVTTYSTAVGTRTLTGVSASSSTQSNTINLPFVRPIPIVFELRGFKPYATLHGFIDNVIADININPAVQIVISGEVGKFLGYKDTSPGNSYNVLRDVQINDLQGSLNSQYPDGHWQQDYILGSGETIRYTTGGTTYGAVVVAREVQLNPTTKVFQTVLHCILMREYIGLSGTTATSYTPASIPTGVMITGDISGSTANVVSVTTPTTLQTNSLGNAFGYYLVPPGTIVSGTNEVAFSDDTSNNQFIATTSGANTFTADGTLNVNTTTNTFSTYTYQQSYTYSVAHTSSVTTNQAVTNTVTVPVYTTTNTTINYTVDPLAETFIVSADKTNGCFVTSVDLYFSSINTSETLPVYVQITDTVNGYPGTNVLFNAVATMYPSQINVSSDASLATRFYFQGPVFLQPGVEYALKVLSNSQSYNVYIAQMGDIALNKPTTAISGQPYSGSFFTSQNNSTWTANQNQDLMFQLNCAQFTSTTGLLEVQNLGSLGASAMLPTNPFMVGNTMTVSKVRYPNHGLFAGAQVTFSGSTATIFNATFTVTGVIDSDHFLISLGTAQTFTGLTGGSAVMATKNIKYDSLRIGVGNNFAIPAATSIVTNVFGASTGSVDTVSITANINKIVGMPATKYVHSNLNETLFLGGNKSLTVEFNLTSNDQWLSPMINRTTLTAACISNRVTPPTTSMNTVLDSATITSAYAGIVFNATTSSISIPTTLDINQFRVGASITVSGTTSNNNTFTITKVDPTTSPYMVYVYGTNAIVNEAPTATTIVQQTGFIDEIAPSGSSAETKYITIPISFDTTSTGIQLMFDAAVPPPATLLCFYRTMMTSNSGLLENQPWVPINMNYTNSQPGNYLPQKYSIVAIPDFNTAQFKVVMTSTDSTLVPAVQNFRAICFT